MVSRAAATVVSSLFFSKWAMIMIFGLILYLGGAFSIIFDNPILIVFIGLIFVVLYTFGK